MDIVKDILIEVSSVGCFISAGYMFFDLFPRAMLGELPYGTTDRIDAEIQFELKRRQQLRDELKRLETLSPKVVKCRSVHTVTARQALRKSSYNDYPTHLLFSTGPVTSKEIMLRSIAQVFPVPVTKAQSRSRVGIRRTFHQYLILYLWFMAVTA